MSVIRVGYVDHALQLGGAQKSLLELVAHLDRERFEPVVICGPDAVWLDRPELAGVEKVPLFPSTPLLARKRDELASSAAGAGRDVRAGLGVVMHLCRGMKRLRLDIIHTNTLKAHLLGGAAARLCRLPLVWHVRDILEAGAGREWLLRAARVTRPRVVAISDAVAAQFDPRPPRITRIHNGIPLDRFTPGAPPASLREELALAPDAQVLCVVGRLTPWKGHQALLSALQTVSRAHPAAVLLVVGEPAFWDEAYGDDLRDMADDLGVSGSVRWLGFRDDIPDLLRISDVFVLPSVDEPFGRAIIEAMAVGKPVVATRSGGVPEVVVHGQTGLLVEPSDPVALAGALNALLDDPDHSREMGTRGMLRARECFDVRRVAASVGALYDEILPGPNR